MSILKILKNRHKVLGQNARNLSYVKKYGNRRGRKIADDKLLSKEILQAEGIPVPELLGVIRTTKDLRKFNWDILPKSFVMKPVHGTQGGGIQIFYNRDKDGNWIRSDGTKVSKSEIINSSKDILDGKYSINGEADQVGEYRSEISGLNFLFHTVNKDMNLIDVITGGDFKK